MFKESQTNLKLSALALCLSLLRSPIKMVSDLQSLDSTSFKLESVFTDRRRIPVATYSRNWGVCNHYLLCPQHKLPRNHKRE